MWDLEEVCEAACGALCAESDRLALEQAPLGIDALDELSTHPLLRAGFESLGFGVHAEVRYPSACPDSRRTEGERCDIVLTSSPSIGLLDPSEGDSLFRAAAAEPEDAFWLEVKVVGQHVLYEGYARANPQYTSELLQGVSADVRKLSREERIAHGAAILVLMCATEEVAAHDVGIWRDRAIERGLPISAPITRSFRIRDVIGNAFCSVSLVRVHHL